MAQRALTGGTATYSIIDDPFAPHRDEPAPSYPGAPVLLTDMRRGSELGDIRVQDFGETVTGGRYKVCQFLPGIVECSPGDTPKVWPEIHQIVTTLDEAGEVFARYVEQAHAAGWSDTDAD